jgi:hypothetical protein
MMTEFGAESRVVNDHDGTADRSCGSRDPFSAMHAQDSAVIAPPPATAAMSARLYALGKATPSECRGRGEPVVVLAVDEARGQRIASALAQHFLVVRPHVPWEVIVDAPGCESWLQGVLDGLGLATLAAVVATEPLSHAATHAGRAGGVAAEWFVIASARAMSAGDAPSDERIATLRGALAAAGLATRVTGRQCASLERRAV